MVAGGRNCERLAGGGGARPGGVLRQDPLPEGGAGARRGAQPGGGAVRLPAPGPASRRSWSSRRADRCAIAFPGEPPGKGRGHQPRDRPRGRTAGPPTAIACCDPVRPVEEHEEAERQGTARPRIHHWPAAQEQAAGRGECGGTRADRYPEPGDGARQGRMEQCPRAIHQSRGGRGEMDRIPRATRSVREKYAGVVEYVPPRQRLPLPLRTTLSGTPRPSIPIRAAPPGSRRATRSTPASLLLARSPG